MGSSKIRRDGINMTEMKKYDLVIIGAGPAGLTAAIYGRRAGLSVLVVEKESHGGQLQLTDAIENWPGTRHINGFELGTNFQEHARDLGTEFLSATVEKLRAEHDRRFVTTSAGELEAGAVIIATGARFSHLGIPGEAEFTGRGVSYCAVCDGPFYRGREVAVIGGGNTAVEEAEYLCAFADKVYLVHRRGEFRAGRYVVEKALAHPKIVPVLHQVATAVRGDASGVTALDIKDVRDGDEKTLDVAGVFIFVGTVPHSGFLGGFLETEAGGWITTNRHLATSRPGVFAAGDVRDTDLRQVITAAADGARAAMSAYHFLNEWDLISRDNTAQGGER